MWGPPERSARDAANGSPASDADARTAPARDDLPTNPPPGGPTSRKQALAIGTRQVPASESPTNELLLAFVIALRTPVAS